MNFASKLSFLWLVHPLCSLGYRFVPSTGRHSTLPPSPNREGGGFVGCMLHKKQKALTKTHKKTRAKHKKNSSKPALTPGPSPMGRGGHASQKTFTKAHKKAPLPQRPKPHHLMNCERAVRHRRTALSQFGGCGGTSSPHKKNYLQTWVSLQPEAHVVAAS